MIVVADTTPLNYLILLGFPDVLRTLYGRVVVPPAVFSEMKREGAPPTVRAWIAAPPEWLEEMPATNLDTTLADELGMGERQAISLALELHADVLLIDEAAGRREAKDRNVFVAGTLAILLQASLRGYCDFEDAVKQLRGHGFWLAASTEALMISRFIETKKQSNSQS